MNSISRRMWPVPRKCRAMSSTLRSFSPRLTTMFTFTGPSPAAAAASMPSSTRATGAPTSLTAAKTSSSSESRLTVTRCRPASRSALGLAGEQAAVGGQGDVVDAVDLGQHRDQALDVAPQERLSAGQPQLAHARAGEHAGQPRDLLEREQLRAAQELEVMPEDLLGHAVDAAEVAPVGDRDAQVAQRAVEAVGDGSPCLTAYRGIPSRRHDRTDPRPPCRRPAPSRPGTAACRPSTSSC